MTCLAKRITVILLTVNFLSVTSNYLCVIGQTSVFKEVQLSEEIRSVLTDNILHVWYPAIIDTLHGGFYTNFSYSWERKPDKEKMIVTQARDIWTACKAAEHFPDDKRYRMAADHGFRYLADSMWDCKNGGFVTLKGKRQAARPDVWECKNSYGNAFAIYALAAYYNLSHFEEALKLVKKAFYWLDSVAHDSKQGGYFNFLCNSSPHVDISLPEMQRFKDYNSSIHIMEALAELYKVWPDTLVKKRLSEMLVLVRDTFTASEGYLQLYFTADWQHFSLRDSTKDKIQPLIAFDHVSFGHDIETAFLLLEASKTLGIHNDTLTLKTAKMLIDHTLAHGFDEHFSGILEGGYYFKDVDSITIVMRNKVWWAQAEGLNALLLFSKLYPDEKIYKLAFTQLWEYVKKNMIDFEHGDWYANGLDQTPKAKKWPKATAWKCNYHTGRALMNCFDMLNGKDILKH